MSKIVAEDESEGILQVKEGVVWKSDGLEIVIYHPDGGLFFLDEIASLAWDMLVNGATRTEILSNILREYDVEERIALRDLDELLLNLRTYELVDDSSHHSKGEE